MWNLSFDNLIITIFGIITIIFHEKWAKSTAEFHSVLSNRSKLFLEKYFYFGYLFGGVVFTVVGILGMLGKM